jgi:hypothetical protein
MLALTLLDHYLRHRGQNADVRSGTPNIAAHNIATQAAAAGDASAS